MVGTNNKIIFNTWKLDCVFKNQQIWPNQKIKTVTLHTSYCYPDIALFYKSLAGKKTHHDEPFDENNDIKFHSDNYAETL